MSSADESKPVDMEVNDETDKVPDAAAVPAAGAELRPSNPGEKMSDCESDAEVAAQEEEAEELCILDPEAVDVDLNHGRIAKIENLEGLRQVETLSLRWNLIKKIENLSMLTTLRELELYDNQVRNCCLLSVPWTPFYGSFPASFRVYCYFFLVQCLISNDKQELGKKEEEYAITTRLFLGLFVMPQQAII